MMKKIFTILTSILFWACQGTAQPNIQLVNFATGFNKPLDIAHCGDDRLFIVEQDGVIRILDKNGTKLPTPFLDINARVSSNGNERGLLGLAFHPDYANNGYFFVNYTNNSNNTRVSRFSVSANDPNVADPNSELILFEVNQPFSNHNGGCVKFGPDGYLYTGLGDGGSGGDPQGNGQKRSTLLGKMIRIDVDNGSPYAIPSDNPFLNDPSTLDEIWAIGVRNPWRFSFDRKTGDLWIGDVGQDNVEEVDFQPASSPGGENYGWNITEGTYCFPPNVTNCDTVGKNFTFPVAEYLHGGNTGCSITGGFMYRGCRYPQLYGHYLYTDYCTGIIWSLRPDGQGGWINEQLANLVNNQFVSFGENKNGELYLAGLGNGIIYRVTEGSASFEYDFTANGVACPDSEDGSISLSFSGSVGMLQVAWSNGDMGPEITNLAAGTYMVTISGSNGCTATETIAIETQQQLNATVTNESCEGSSDGAISVDLVGNVEPFSVLWDDGSTNPDRTGLPNGTYTVTVTGDEGCSFTAAYDVETAQTLAISFQNETCPGDADGAVSIELMGNAEPFSVVWADGATGPERSGLAAGTYMATITGDEGCTFVETVVVETEFDAPPLPVIAVAMNTELTVNTGYASYQWLLDGQAIPGANGPTLTATATGQYTVSVTNANGCGITSAPVSVNVSGLREATGLEELTLTPNPFGRSLHVKIRQGQALAFDLAIKDEKGAVMLSEKAVPAAFFEKTFDLGHLPPGLYYFVVKTEHGEWTERVVRQ
ncbi:MAG: PQQ-dependent sugar dehydrogenase [Lewinellaceae bacterium]|nr:PQQ-dependent sugar dehydrogenase [Saprospiraceae bacterium]MCB9339519.1 PQQ-dependent sugar dehydrogenase [Lewinellaceae bacterium]